MLTRWRCEFLLEKWFYSVFLGRWNLFCICLMLQTDCYYANPICISVHPSLMFLFSHALNDLLKSLGSEALMQSSASAASICKPYSWFEIFGCQWVVHYNECWPASICERQSIVLWAIFFFSCQVLSFVKNAFLSKCIIFLWFLHMF